MPNLSITILDDDEFMLSSITAMLHGFDATKVNTFTSADAALSQIDLHDHMLVVLCDLQMPGMDGVEFLRHLAECHFAGGIVVFSGEDVRTLHMVENLVRAQHLHLLGVLHKPIDRTSLLNLLDQMCCKGNTKQPRELLLSEHELREGLTGNSLIQVFQPQVDIRTRQIVGVEALARWSHPRYGILGPHTFIPIAERSGLIIRLTDVMITQSIRQWRNWFDNGYDFGISVNVSMDCLSRIDFPDWVVAEAAAVGMPLDRLMLEITESRLMQNTVKALDVLSRLCLKRVRLSIDDFGTAYSNMEKLQMLPFNELKIDRAFVNGAAENDSSRAILESSAALGKRLNMKIVAEGVETREDWECAAQAGCDLIQGFYVARPMPGEELIDWVFHYR
ncbi:MAG: hypothetical protein CTY19_12355 [Methylomonas sp.]|nr:MAG: hypothetical protein CTY19_12355 [Methylomonas sp.]